MTENITPVTPWSITQSITHHNGITAITHLQFQDVQCFQQRSVWPVDCSYARAVVTIILVSLKQNKISILLLSLMAALEARVGGA